MIYSLFKLTDSPYAEWSLSLSDHKLQFRKKPTIYLYPGQKEKNFAIIQKALLNLNCPPHIINLQKTHSAESIYMGLRVPENEAEDNILFIHPKNKSIINGYRWKNKNEYKESLYEFKSESLHHLYKDSVHENLRPTFNAITKFSNVRGIWVQTTRTTIKEVYITFKDRPKLKELIANIKTEINEETYLKLQQFKELNFKNIGFDSKHTTKPIITIYFSFSINKCFPSNYAELVSRTKDLTQIPMNTFG